MIGAMNPSNTDNATQSLGAERPSHAIAQYRLRVVAGADAGTTFETRGARTVIGSHESCELRLTDPAVSRFHCSISVDAGGATITDLGSRNGTLVNGVTVLAARLAAGMTITLGRTKLHVEAGDSLVRVPVSSRTQFGLLVGTSRAMGALFAMLERAAASESTVLLEGETGTGKDAAAAAIHQESARRDGPFVVVDCGSLPPNLIESELFGHERGAFTGAQADRMGAFEAAHGGTLFIDEIGELPLELQPKLLRALDRREIRRVGATERREVDVRVVAATNRNLRAEVNAGTFRADLYYRLAVLDIALPPLRERTEDLPLIIEQLAERIGVADAARLAPLRSPELLARLASHPWPGNVRELRNYVERCVAFEQPVPLTPAEHEDPLALLDPRQPLRIARERWTRLMERTYLERLLALHDDNVAAAARAAGIDRVHMHRLLSRVGLR